MMGFLSFTRRAAHEVGWGFVWENADPVKGETPDL
jgi:hypothetical protein